ncbi:MAG: MlaD family protein [Candidatus Eisenbacteria bacterium]|nr:MlaD family protein [Candidatus Eisenbacteria bacterium]
MSLEANRFRLGVFFSLGAVLVVSVLTWLTGWFGGVASRTYVCYFSESVQGLENGTAVRYNGVPVGKVERIAVAPDGRLVEVRVSIETGFPVGPDLAARLDFVGITGIRVVNLRIATPQEAPRTALSFRPAHPVIPVVKSQLEAIDMGLQGLLKIMADVDFARISDHTVLLLDNLNRVLEPGRIESLSTRLGSTAENADSLVAEYRLLGQRLNRLAAAIESDAGPIRESVEALATEMTDLAESVGGVPASVDRLTTEGVLLLRQLRLTLDTLRDHPEQFFTPSQEDEWP